MHGRVPLAGQEMLKRLEEKHQLHFFYRPEWFQGKLFPPEWLGLPDWGIIGLSYCPGKACVASTFRLKKKNIREQFFKIAIHELGYTQGLDHCPGKSCFMRAFQGKDIASELTSCCLECRKLLIKRGWTL